MSNYTPLPRPQNQLCPRSPGLTELPPPPLLSLSAPRYPPWGPLAKVAATAANRPLRGRLGSGAGPTVRLVAHSVRPELAYPQRYSARRSGGAQG